MVADYLVDYFPIHIKMEAETPPKIYIALVR